MAQGRVVQSSGWPSRLHGLLDFFAAGNRAAMLTLEKQDAAFVLQQRASRRSLDYRFEVAPPVCVVDNNQAIGAWALRLNHGRQAA